MPRAGNTFLTGLIVAAFTLVTLLTILPTAPVMAASTVSFTTVVDNINLREHTKFHVKEYMRDIKGAEVQWSGKVVDVIGGRDKVKVLVANDQRRLIRGHNIVLLMFSGLDKAAALRKGQLIHFKGYINRLKPAKQGGAVVFLQDALLLP